MGIRRFDRIPVLINVTLTFGSGVHAGTVTNLSEKGMYIRTDRIPSVADSAVEVLIPLNEEKIRLSCRLIRKELIREYYNGMAVEVVNPPDSYLDFLDNLLAVL
ncbi:MAG: PilZ domain-containing protein [Nitrospirae bacterium]|nr:PilZ domain-containing protein [Nitrospirota bacterium]